MGVVEPVIAVLCLVAAVWLVVLLVADRLPNDALFALLGLVELGLLVDLVLGVVRVLSQPHAGVSVATYVGYLIAAVVLPPAAVLWSLADRSRGGTGVLLVAVLVVPFLFLRLGQVWHA